MRKKSKKVSLAVISAMVFLGGWAGFNYITDHNYGRDAGSEILKASAEYMNSPNADLKAALLDKIKMHTSNCEDRASFETCKRLTLISELALMNTNNLDLFNESKDIERALIKDIMSRSEG